VHLAVPIDRWQSEEWQVMLDAHALAPDAATSPIAVDRGRHVVTATAPSKRAFVRDFDVADGATVQIAIAQLEDVSAPAHAPTPAPKAALEPVFVLRDDVPRRNWGIGLGATGLASLGVGVVSGIVAANLHAKSDNLCPAATGCVGDGVDAENQANRAAWVADVTVVAGVALVGLGTYLFLSAMHAKRVPAANDAALGRVVFDLR